MKVIIIKCFDCYENIRLYVREDLEEVESQSDVKYIFSDIVKKCRCRLTPAQMMELNKIAESAYYMSKRRRRTAVG